MKPNALVIYNFKNMKKLYTTKNFDHLFTICNEEGNYVFGFDMLDDSKFIQIYYDDVIEINPTCKLLENLVTNDSTKVALAEFMFESVEKQAKYLGISDRTLLRLKSNTNKIKQNVDNRP